MVANENSVDVQTLESVFIDSVAIEMGYVIGAIENRIQNATLAALDKKIPESNQLAVRSMIASSEVDAASVSENPEHGE